MTAKRLNRFIATLMIVCGTITLVPIASAQTTRRPQQAQLVRDQLAEEFAFLIKELKVDHQGDNTLNIKIRLRYKERISDSEYPDYRPIAKDVETMLANYPNETDYWEIVNKKLTQMILDKNPAVIEVTSEIEILPSAAGPLRSSTTKRSRNQTAAIRRK